MKHERYFDGAPVRPVPARVLRGRVAHSAGCLAEASVARAYVDQGHELIAERYERTATIVTRPLPNSIT